MTLAEVLKGAVDYLAARGIDTPRVDAELLLARALGLQRIELYTQHDRPLTEAERAQARDLVRRRGAREPLAYVLGDWDFRRLTLKTDARALVPRPETEIVVERCLTLIKDMGEPRIVDVGTGTGAIALALKHERPDARVTATDRSADALSLARENAEANGLEIELLEADLLEGVAGPFELVVSNPPYVAADELAMLEPELTYEPEDALVDRGQTQRLIRTARFGWLVLEVHERRARRRGRRADAGRIRRRAGRTRPRRPRPDRRGTMEPVAALEAGLPVLLPTDTVYGLVSAPGEEPARTLYDLKGRTHTQPTAILAATIDALLEAVPELDTDQLRKLLPGPYTLVVANPAGPLPMADGRRARTDRRASPAAAAGNTRDRRDAADRPRDERERSRRPESREPRRRSVAGSGAAAARSSTSGPLPGTPSTVIDLTGDEPRILREGAVPATEALRRLRA